MSWRIATTWTRSGVMLRRMTGLPAPDDWDIQWWCETEAEAERVVQEKNADECERRLLGGDR